MEGCQPEDILSAVSSHYGRRPRYRTLSTPESSTSNSTSSPATVKITRSQMLVTRSAVRSRLWATHSR